MASPIEQQEFPFARSVNIDREIIEKSEHIRALEVYSSTIESGQVNILSRFYKVGCAGIGAYITWRMLGGEAPRFSIDGWENEVSLIVKYISPFLILTGLGANYFLNKMKNRAKREKTDAFKDLSTLIDEEEKIILRNQ